MKNFNKINNLHHFIKHGAAYHAPEKVDFTCQSCHDTGVNIDEKTRVWPCDYCLMGTLSQVKSSDHVEYNDDDVKNLALHLYGQFLEANNFASNLLERKFMHFNKGDSAIDVWHWFESTFNVSAIELDRKFNEQENMGLEKEPDDAVF